MHEENRDLEIVAKKRVHFNFKDGERKEQHLTRLRLEQDSGGVAEEKVRI